MIPVSRNWRTIISLQIQVIVSRGEQSAAKDSLAGIYATDLKRKVTEKNSVRQSTYLKVFFGQFVRGKLWKKAATA